MKIDWKSPQQITFKRAMGCEKNSRVNAIQSDQLFSMCLDGRNLYSAEIPYSFEMLNAFKKSLLRS